MFETQMVSEHLKLQHIRCFWQSTFRLCYRHRYFRISSSAFLLKSSSTNAFCSFFVYRLFHFWSFCLDSTVPVDVYVSYICICVCFFIYRFVMVFANFYCCCYCSSFVFFSCLICIFSFHFETFKSLFVSDLLIQMYVCASWHRSMDGIWTVCE